MFFVFIVYTKKALTLWKFNRYIVTTDIVKEKVRGILDSYLEINNHRKTTERFAILDAVYDMQGHFSLEELGEKMSKDKPDNTKNKTIKAIYNLPISFKL